MTRKRKLLIIAAAVPVLLVTMALLYVNFADLSGWRDTVAGMISASLGRELTIAGEFEPDIGFTTRLMAGSITLANADWSDDPYMVSADRLEIEIDLLSLLFGPITIHDVEITGARVLFELNADGRLNWDFESSGSSDGGGGEVELVLEHVLANDLQLAYRTPSRMDSLEAAIGRLESTADEKGMLDLDLVGTIGGTPVEISGRLGTFIGLINAATVEHDLTGRFADAEFSLRGTIDDLGSLTGVETDASASGSELGHISASFGLDPVIDGPFTVEASVKQSVSGSDFNLDAAAGGMSAHITGVVDSLTEPSILDATITASGPSVRTVGALTGVAGLPDEEFLVSGGVRWEGFPITFKQVEISVGDNTLSADGVLGAPPQMLGTDFTMQGEGPNASSLGALVGVDLPRQSFSVSGRVVRVDGGLEVENLETRIGRAEVTADGKVGDPPNYAGTTLSIHAAGPNIAHFKHLIGIELPAEDFTIDGRLAQGQEAITLEGVTARLGRNTLRVDGILKIAEGLSGTTLKVAAQGPDATQLRALTDLKDLPHEAWSIAGGVAFVDPGLRLDAVSASVGSLTAHADGRVATVHGPIGTNLRLHVEDSDLSHAMPIFGVNGFPPQPIRVDGGLKIEGSGYRLDSVTATAGDIDVAVDGLIGARLDLDGTRGHLAVRGPRLSSLGPYFHQPGLPQAPFSVTGNVQVTGGRIDLGNVVAEVDSNRVTAHGAVVPVKGLVGTDVHIEISAPDLGRAGRLAAGLTTLPDLPAEPFTLTTHLQIDDAGYEIDGLHATLDRMVAAVDGRVGAAAKWVGTDLTVTANGPKASLFTAITGVTIPVAPFKVSGRVQRTDNAILFNHVAVELGGHSITLHGSLGEAPRLVGTDLELYASGNGTALIAELTGIRELPDRPFKFSGRFHGTPERFTADSLDVVLGESDVKGSLEVDIRGKPEVTARFVSSHLDLESVIPRRSEQGDEASATQAASHPSKDSRVISNEPIDFGWLQRADADMDITIGTLQMPVERFHDVEITARLADGRLDVHRLAMAGSRGGSGSGSLVFEPADSGYRADVVLNLDAVRFDLPGEDAGDDASAPPLDFDVRLQAQGTSPHGFASSANGSIQIVVGKGVMDNRVLDLISQDFLITLLTAFNPFAKDEAATELQCAIALLTFEDGLATLEPMAVQSNKMTMLGKGRIDLGTEKLNFEWITKPRKGIGLSASMITNPYIKLGGTLSNPSVQLKGVEAVASTSVAVATLGLSVLAKGMLDRITAEKKVCKQALEEIGRRSGSPTKKPKKGKKN